MCSRRQWLTQAGTTATLTLAGCLFTESESTPQSSTDLQSDTDTSGPSTSESNESSETSETPTPSTPQITVDLTVPETLETGMEDTYRLRVKNTGDTETAVTYGVDMRRPQMVYRTRTTAETTLEPDTTHTRTRSVTNWDAGTLGWVAWATAGESRVTTTASTTVTVSTRSWGSTYQPATGHVLSISTPTLTHSYTGTRSDGSLVTVSATSGQQLAVIQLQVRNSTSEQRRTPHVNSFQLHTTSRIKRPHASIGAGTTHAYTDLGPSDSEQWTLLYEIPATTTRGDLLLTHTSGGHYTGGGWQVHWR